LCDRLLHIKHIITHVLAMQASNDCEHLANRGRHVYILLHTVNTRTIQEDSIEQIDTREEFINRVDYKVYVSIKTSDSSY